MMRRAIRFTTGSPLPLALGGLCLIAALVVGVPDLLAPNVSDAPALPRELTTDGSQPLDPIDAIAQLDPRKVALGERLFHETRLSSDGSLSCASCHDLAKNGASGQPKTTRLNTPTVFNAVFSYRYGWEGKFRTLEAQARATLEDTMMSGSEVPARVYRQLGEEPGMAAAFDDIYGQAPSGETIANALAEFERSLVTPSRFDRWLKGDRTALTDREQRGYRSFVRLGCIACHQGRNVGGNLMQKQGIFRRLASPPPVIVRVPSLRNVAETAPYFHDGSAATLEEAIRRMASAQLNRNLSDEEVAQVATFLTSLTGSYRGSPVHH